MEGFVVEEEEGWRREVSDFRRWAREVGGKRRDRGTEGREVWWESMYGAADKKESLNSTHIKL